MMNDMKVRTRLALGFGALLVLMLVVVGVAFVSLQEVGLEAAVLAKRDDALVAAANAMLAAQLEQAVAVRDFVSREDRSSEKASRDALERSEEAYDLAAAALAGHASGLKDDYLQQLAGKAHAGQAPVTNKTREVMALVENGEYERARSLVYKDMLPMQRAVMSNLATLASVTTELAKARADLAEAHAARALTVIAVMLAVSLAVGVLGTLWLARGITRPLNSAVSVTERVAAGDLTAHIDTTGHDETGRLLAALARMQASLHDMATSIRDGASVVSEASEEIARGNSDLSSRTEGHASSLEQIAASIEELTGTVKQNAESAKSASALAKKAAAEALGGGDIVGRVVKTMDGIEASSRRMSDIVGVIDGIAFQTNLLALNAAVEAARAGEQGRGFGVVATEVRALAQRSAMAAKEIKDLIGGSVSEAEAAAKLADEAGASITRIIDAAEQVSKLVADISTASQEQRAGIEQISGAIGNMEEGTQRNAALVEETNAATQQLLDQARGLVSVVGRFKLDQGEDRERAIAMVKKAVSHLSAAGPQRAFDDFEDPAGLFQMGDLYVMVFDGQGVIQAHGRRPEIRGRNDWDVTDADGKHQTREVIEVATTRGAGWIDYRWENPRTGQIEPKSTYVEGCGDYIVGCGVYRAENTPMLEDRAALRLSEPASQARALPKHS
jgi:methyl-accepting chemotaxis protein